MDSLSIVRSDTGSESYLAVYESKEVRKTKYIRVNGGLCAAIAEAMEEWEIDESEVNIDARN